jgi:mono/diheme cytochrome c family protein
MRTTYLAALALMCANPVLAQSTGNALAGHALARQWCASCHLIASGEGRTSDVAPAFEAVARRPSTTQTSLRVFLQTPHRQMPNYTLTRQETDDVVAYILGLRR